MTTWKIENLMVVVGERATNVKGKLGMLSGVIALLVLPVKASLVSVATAVRATALASVHAARETGLESCWFGLSGSRVVVLGSRTR
jgi:hypothetical protein